MSDPLSLSQGDASLQQTTTGDRNQTIGQVLGGIVVYVSGGQATFNTGQDERETPAKTAHPTIGANPYRGLMAFQETDGDRFFGREKQITDLWSKLRQLHEAESTIRLLPIYGPSGSGKSSLARAGLIPELAKHPIPGYDRARVAVLVPGTHPLEALATVLTRIATNDPIPVTKTREFATELAQRTQTNEYDGLRRIADVLPDITLSPLIVLVDQFEEVYTLCETQDERDAFIANLLHAASDRAKRVSVIITLRSDFLGETQKHSVLNALFAEQGFLVRSMDEEELRRAIAEPAKQAGRPLDEATIDLLIEQSEGREGALPLLQFALTRIWEGMRAGKTPYETLRAINGVGGALREKAQDIYDSLKTKEQDFARRLFIGVVELGEGTKDTRRRATVESLMSPQDEPALVQAVIERFSAPGARLLTLSSAEEKEVVEVTHEALFDHWQQLQGWLDGQRDLIRQQRRINTLAQEWKTQSKNRGYLLQGRQLDDAKAFQKRYASTLPLTGLAAELVCKSIRQRWVNRMMVASLAVIPLVAIEGFLREDVVKQDYTTLQRDDVAAKTQAVLALTVGCGELKQWPSLLYPLGERVFGNCRFLFRRNLEKVDLSNADLSGANLSLAKLSGANLSLAKLSGADLSGADLSGANLSLAKLSGAKLSGADLNKTDLSGADLNNADLSKADLSFADLRLAKLSGADLSFAYIIHANLSYANLSYANISDANLSYANLSGANLSYANLSKVHLAEVNLSKVNLTYADLTYAELCQTTGIDPDEIKQAKNWTEALYTKEFRAELGLPLLPATNDPCN